MPRRRRPAAVETRRAASSADSAPRAAPWCPGGGDAGSAGAWRRGCTAPGRLGHVDAASAGGAPKRRASCSQGCRGGRRLRPVAPPQHAAFGSLRLESTPAGRGVLPAAGCDDRRSTQPVAAAPPDLIAALQLAAARRRPAPCRRLSAVPCAAVPEALRDQAEAGQEGQAEPPHPALDPLPGRLRRGLFRLRHLRQRIVLRAVMHPVSLS